MSADWTPDLPLRSDATDAQMADRFNRLEGLTLNCAVPAALKQVARELCAARLAAVREKIEGLPSFTKTTELGMPKKVFPDAVKRAEVLALLNGEKP